MNRPSRTDASRRPAGFTLIDLVAVTAVIALVLAIGVHFIQEARNTAQATGCRENLRQIGVALAHYADTHRVLPVVTLIGPGFQLCTQSSIAVARLSARRSCPLVQPGPALVRAVCWNRRRDGPCFPLSGLVASGSG